VYSEVGSDAKEQNTPERKIDNKGVASYWASMKSTASYCAQQRRRWMSRKPVVLRRRFLLLVALLMMAVVLPGMWMCYVYVYSKIVSHEPCAVAVETLEKFAKFSNAETKTLPKIIHQQWKTEVIPKGPFTEFRAKFKELFPEPEYTYMLWTDESARELIKNDFAFFLEAYDNYKYAIQRADATRYFALYKYGGLYADLDYEPLINFWKFLPQHRVGLVESPYVFGEKTQNSLMSSPARDPFWNTSFQVLLERRNMEGVLDSTGPVFLDNVQARVAESSYARLPCENFQRMPLGINLKYDLSPYYVRMNREIKSRLIPMKYCGDFHDNLCQFGRHHNSVVYNAAVTNRTTGLVDILWDTFLKVFAWRG
jgi:hypothetical protein